MEITKKLNSTLISLGYSEVAEDDFKIPLSDIFNDLDSLGYIEIYIEIENVFNIKIDDSKRSFNASFLDIKNLIKSLKE